MDWIAAFDCPQTHALAVTSCLLVSALARSKGIIDYI